MESEWWSKVQEDPRAIRNVPDAHLTEALCMEAARLGALSSVPVSRRTAAVCHAAVLHEPVTFYQVPCNMKSKELCRLAVAMWPPNIECVPRDMCTDAVCELAIAKVTSTTAPVLRGLPERYRNDIEVCWKVFV